MTPPPRLDVLTMCDLRFLPQALVLHRSLERHAPSFRLRVLCMDKASERVLAGASLAGVETVSLTELEECDPALAAVKGERTWPEYCWTATPAFCRLGLDRAGEQDVLLWVDADLQFLRDPRAWLDELGDGSVLLTPHEYYRAYPASASASYLTERWGAFNGGAIAFRRDEQGCAAIALWRSRSLEWCHDRLEPGLYGNQLHLVDFPARFSGTRILRVPGGGLGPWNAAQYRIAQNGAGITAEGLPVIFYHHQSLRLYRRPLHLRPLRLPSNVFRLPGTRGALVGRTNPRYRLSRDDRRLIWRPYVGSVAKAAADVAVEHPAWDAGFEPLTLEHLRADASRRLEIGVGRVKHGVRNPGDLLGHRSDASRSRGWAGS